ncbi:MAG: sugar ABC transporter ATP-binding protein [bacterium]
MIVPSNMQPALHINGVTRRFGATIALDGVDLVVQPGEVHALIGENGAGKSTLMGIVAGALKADRGTMQLGGAPYAPNNPHDARHLGVALIHQELSLCPHLSVLENVLLGAEQSHLGLINVARSRERARELLAELPHPEIHPDRKLRELSLPARQIVEVCRALASDARVLLMDEPTSSLQGADVDRLFALIRKLAARGIAVVYISHFLEEIRQIATRYTVLRDGKTVATGDIAGVKNDELISKMVGRSATGLFPTRTRNTTGDVALSVCDLAAPPRLTRASFNLHRGEILGIAGLLGSGRTELVRALFSLTTPTAGTVRLHGHQPEATRTSTAMRVKQGVGYLSEDRKGEGLSLSLSIADNLCATKPEYKHRAAGILNLERQAERARHWIRELRVTASSPAQLVRSLSGGNQQKIAIGRLLHQEADILLLDEPTRGIDIGSKADVYDIIARRTEAGCAVLMVSSYLPELFGLCDRIAVMCRGQLSEARATADWTPEQVMATALGLD